MVSFCHKISLFSQQRSAVIWFMQLDDGMGQAATQSAAAAEAEIRDIMQLERKKDSLARK
jgi:hypothetical protein